MPASVEQGLGGACPLQDLIYPPLDIGYTGVNRSLGMREQDKWKPVRDSTQQGAISFRSRPHLLSVHSVCVCACACACVCAPLLYRV